MNYMKISYFNEFGEEVFINLPARLETCSSCIGNGLIDNSNFLFSKAQATCPKCGGVGTQKVIDESSFSAADRKHYRKYINEISANDFSDLEWIKEFKYDSMMGKW